MSLSSIFSALADPTRREIVSLLRHRDMTAGELADRFDLARSTLSGHCRVLKDAGLIVSERNRTTVVYSVNTSAFDEAVAAVLGYLRHDRRGRQGAASAGSDPGAPSDRDDSVPPSAAGTPRTED